MAVETLRPSAAGDETAIAGVSGAATHWQAVDEASPDDATTYVREWGTSYKRDLYNLDDHSVGSGTINSVTIYFRILSDEKTAYAKPSQKSGATVTDGTEVTQGASWATKSQQYTTNPATSAAYSWAEIDALQVGVSLKTSVSGWEARCTQVYVEVDYTPLSAWAHQQEINIDHDDIDATLTNFPILLHISASCGRDSEDLSAVFDELASDANRKKIAVTIDDEVTQCYVEIEKWDDANEQAWLWVKVPSISNAVDTKLYLFYDSAQADNTSYVGDTNSEVAENVWDANFVAVYHMADGADTSHIYDSTGNDKDGTKVGAGAPAVTTSGKVGNAQDFDGSDDNIDCGDINDMEGVDKITVEAWVKLDDPTNTDDEIVTKDDATNRSWSLVQLGNAGPGDGSIRWLTKTGAVVYCDSTTKITTSVWTYVAGVYDGGHIYSHLNGGSAESSTIQTGNIAANSEPVLIGDRGDGFGTLTGLVDEVRLSKINRPAAWLKATYETGRDNLLFFTSGAPPQTIIGNGIASTISLGTTKLNLIMLPSGRASSISLGTPQLNFIILPTGKASSISLGSPQLNLIISPSGVVSSITLGTPILLTALVLLPDGIASTLTIGTPQLLWDLILSPSAIESTLGLGTSQLNLTILPDGRVSSVSLGTPVMGMFILPSGVTSTLSLGTPFMIFDQFLSPSGIGTTSAFGTAQLNLLLQMVGINSTISLGSPQLNFTILPTGMASTISLGSPQLNFIILPVGIVSTNAFGTAMITFALVLIPTGIASTLAIGSPQLNLIILGSGIASTLSLGTAQLNLIILPSGIASSVSLGTAQLNLILQVIGIASTLALGTASLFFARLLYLVSLIYSIHNIQSKIDRIHTIESEIKTPHLLLSNIQSLHNIESEIKTIHSVLSDIKGG